MAHIGFVGLGHMGRPMAINLVKAGHHVTGFDLMPEALVSFAKDGGNVACSAIEATSNKDIIITMLQTGQQVHSICLGESGIFTAASKHALYIDCSSIDIEQSRELHQHAKICGLKVVDAPVSGGVSGAVAATLTVMVGGTTEDFAYAKPILACVGKKIIHCGAAGNGQAAKICNNMILGVSMIAVSEAFILAEKLGLTAQKLHEVTTNSSGQCWVMSNYVPVPDVLENVPANNNYQPGFTGTMMLKDLKLSQGAAQCVDVNTPLAALATQLYQEHENSGMGALDFSSIIKNLFSIA